MNKKIISYLSFLLVFGSLVMISEGCRTEPKATKPTYKYIDNVVRVRLPSEPRNLNPILSRSYGRIPNERIFSYLMEHDPKTQELTPYLAKDKPVVKEIMEGEYKGGTSFTFEIKEEAAWDDGQPVTGYDFEFTLKAVQTPKMPTVYWPYFEAFKKISIDANNPKIFTVVADKKYILNEAALCAIPVYPKHIYDQESILDKYDLNLLNNRKEAEKIAENEDVKRFLEAFTSNLHTREKGGVSGSGPYYLEEWSTGQFIVLKKKKNWWGDQFASRNKLFEAYPEELVFKPIPDQAAALASLKDEELDVASTLDSKDFIDLKSNTSFTEKYNFFSPQSSQIYLWYLNNRDPLLSDKKVRRALAHLMDVDEFINSMYYGLAARAVGPISPTKSYFKKDLKPIPYDLEKANQLFVEAGWTDSDNDGILDKEIDGKKTNFSVEILIGQAKASENLALFYQDALKKAGIEVEIIAKAHRAAITEVRKFNYQIYAGAVSFDSSLDDPKQTWSSSSNRPGGHNYTGFGNSESDALIENIRVTLDPQKRDNLYKEFQQMIYDEQPAIFLFSPLGRLVIHKRFDAEPSTKRPGYFPNTFQLK